MTNIDRLDDLLFKIGTGTGGGYAELIDVAADVVSEVRRETAPQLIRTAEELEALDPDTVIENRAGAFRTAGKAIKVAGDWGINAVLPAVVICEGADVRAARKAWEEA